MVKHILGLCLLACSCFGQAFTLMDPAFLGNVAAEVRANPVMITNGLVAWWKMNDGTGTNVLDSWSTNHLVFQGTPVWTNIGFPNTNCIDFPTNGLRYASGCVTYSTNYLRMLNQNTNFDMGTNQFSVSLWFRHNFKAWKGDILLHALDPTTPATKFQIGAIGYNPTTALGLSVPGVQPAVYAPIGDVRNGVWHFLAFSRSNANYTMWLDATNVYTGYATNIYTFDSSHSDAVYVGNIGSPYCYSVGFDGDIEEIMVRRGYALTTNDVLYLYYTYYGGPPPEYVSPYPNITNNLMVYLKMGEGSGTTLTNSTTNGINGWIQPPASWTDRGHNHKYALNLAQGGYGSTAQLNGYNFITNTDWSIGLWFCHTGLAYGSETLFWKNTSGPNSNPELQRYAPGGGSSLIRWLSQGLNWQQYGLTPLEQKWVFTVITKDISKHVWYLCHDGDIQAITNTDPEVEFYQNAEPAQYTIGNHGTYQWQGYIEEFRIHRNYCLSSNEVWYLYNLYYSP